MSVSKKPMVLVILDGYGYREEQQDNAIFSAKTPVMDALWANRPHTLIDASGLEVGLPDRQMGNSEVGHVNLGAGRIVYQDLTRLDVEIKDRAFFANPVLTGAVDKAKNAGKAVHTNLPVPLIYVGDKNVKAVEGGKLSDIAPTMLSLMGMEIPQEMTGKPLFIVE